MKHGGYPTCDSCHLYSVRKLGLRCSCCRPASATAKRAKKKENRVCAALEEAGILLHREVRISYSCIDSNNKRFARLDVVIECENHRVILEIDEQQHKNEGYSVACDMARMTHVMAAIACTSNIRRTRWIRFNPDAYKVDGVLRRTRMKQRHAALVDAIHSGPDRDFELLYMYYDVDDGQPTIVSDPQYEERFKHIVACVV